MRLTLLAITTLTSSPVRTLLVAASYPFQSHLTYKFLSEELYEYLDAAIMVQTSPEEAYRKVNWGERDTCFAFSCRRVSSDMGVRYASCPQLKHLM